VQAPAQCAHSACMLDRGIYTCVGAHARMIMAAVGVQGPGRTREPNALATGACCSPAERARDTPLSRPCPSLLGTGQAAVYAAPAPNNNHTPLQTAAGKRPTNEQDSADRRQHADAHKQTIQQASMWRVSRHHGGSEAQAPRHELEARMHMAASLEHGTRAAACRAENTAHTGLQQHTAASGDTPHQHKQHRTCLARQGPTAGHPPGSRGPLS
jgi:hypothetical protein